MIDATEAASQLEVMSADLKRAIIDIREHSDDRNYVYWRVYYLRASMSRIVAGLGAGIPPTPKRVYRVDRGEL
jgi:hypothetical protein